MAVFDATGDYGLVQTLVAAGADPNHKDNFDQSPMDFAVIIGNESLRTLLEKG